MQGVLICQNSKWKKTYSFVKSAFKQNNDNMHPIIFNPSADNICEELYVNFIVPIIFAG